MDQKDLASALERLLSERMADAPRRDSSGPLGAVRKASYWFHKCFVRKPRLDSQIAQQEQRVWKIRSLPPHVQELLRRYFVFLEAEKSICSSTGMTLDEFRRVRRQATDYVLSRHDHKPDF
jgi:hypothetical protein